MEEEVISKEVIDGIVYRRRLRPGTYDIREKADPVLKPIGAIPTTIPLNAPTVLAFQLFDFDDQERIDTREVIFNIDGTEVPANMVDGLVSITLIPEIAEDVDIALAPQEIQMTQFRIGVV